MARALPNAPVTPASSSAGASHTYNLRKSSRGFPMTPVEVEILMTIYNRTEKPSRKDKEKLAKELHRSANILFSLCRADLDVLLGPTPQ